MLFQAFGLQQAVIFDCLRFCVAAMPSDPATPACAAPEVPKEATRAAGATTAAGAKPARPTEPKAAAATSDPVINKAAAATSDPVIRFKRGLRQFFDDPETTRKSEYPEQEAKPWSWSKPCTKTASGPSVRKKARK